MAKRIFKLPGVEELNKDQDRVLRLPKDGQFLVVGGPGTGKSVVALLRAMKFGDNKNYVFLTYNRVLEAATKQLVDYGLTGRTINSWFYKVQYKLTKKLMPQNKDGNVDYDKVIENFKELDVTPKDFHILIDEGQDMPPKFYEALMELKLENFFIVADQNQQITDENSSRKELTDLLYLEVSDVIELQQNYRNSHPIALVAQHFFTDKASPKPDLPQISNSALGTPILYTCADFPKFIKFILLEADRDPSNLIGIVVATISILETYRDELRKMEMKLDNAKPMIQSYDSGTKQNVNINFGEGGIVVLCDKSIKGLEFDVVFVIVGGFKIDNNNLDSLRKRFYVMSSRAIKKLVFLQWTGVNCADVEKILPDKDILLRKELN